MRLKTSNKALMKAIHKDREFMDSAYLKMKDKIPEIMTRQEWEKDLSTTPEADKQELEYIIEMKNKYAVLNEIQKRDLITVRVEQAEMYIHSLKTKLEHNDYVDMKSYREGHGEGGQDFIKACSLMLFDKHGGVEENLFLEPDSNIPELLGTYREMLEEILLEEADYEKTVGKKVLQAGKKRGEEQRKQKELRQERCYTLYEEMMKEEHWLKSETKIKKEIAKKMHCDVRTINRYLTKRTK